MEGGLPWIVVQAGAALVGSHWPLAGPLSVRACFVLRAKETHEEEEGQKERLIAGLY